MENSIKVVFQDDTDSVYFNLKDAASVSNGLFGLLKQAENVKKVTYPQSMPKTKNDILAVLKPIVSNLFKVELTKSEVDVWVKGGFGESIDYHTQEFMERKGLSADDKEHQQFITEYEEVQELLAKLNGRIKASVKDSYGRIGLHWHSIPKFKVPRK
jgi:hypothetical protein